MELSREVGFLEWVSLTNTLETCITVTSGEDGGCFADKGGSFSPHPQ